MFGLGFIAGFIVAGVAITIWALCTVASNADDQLGIDDAEMMEQIHKPSALDGQDEMD